ncbi:MAG: hypothetical protein SGJ00_02625 [bacterium]|nr:hypothetical protein [bacterium]
MKNWIFILFALSLVSACTRCDVKQQKLPFVTFYMPKADTLKYPLADYAQLRVYTYYKYGKWLSINALDSNRLVQINWRTLDVLTDSGFTQVYGFLVDQNITATGFANDLGKYDFWLKSINGKLQIKLSELNINYSAPKGKCGDESWEISSSIINDSLLNKHNEPILLR